MLTCGRVAMCTLPLSAGEAVRAKCDRRSSVPPKQSRRCPSDCRDLQPSSSCATMGKCWAPRVRRLRCHPSPPPGSCPLPNSSGVCTSIRICTFFRLLAHGFTLNPNVSAVRYLLLQLMRPNWIGGASAVQLAVKVAANWRPVQPGRSVAGSRGGPLLLCSATSAVRAPSAALYNHHNFLT